jgi:very-short-patch-repair endonuclease
MKPSDSERTALNDIFRYLQELVQLRATTIYDVNSYEERIWLADLLQTKGCEVNVGSGDTPGEATWLVRMSKPSVPKRPDPSAAIREWLDPSTLDQTETYPTVLSELPDPTDPAGEPRTLSDDPQLEASIYHWIEQIWEKWREQYVPAKQSADLYDSIHSLHLLMKREGQVYELVVASALMTARHPEVGVIRRHLLTLPVSVEFAAERGVLTIAPESDLAQSRLETDMIPVSLKPEPAVETLLKNSAHEITTQIWHEPTVHSTIAPYLNERADRDYDHSPQRALNTSAAKFVTFAPAVLLRRRGERDVLRLLGEIGYVLQSADDVPEPILELVRAGYVEEHEPADRFVGTDNLSDDVDDVLLPLPANSEQVAIVRDLARHNLVRVQGPPGTGKSHTIVNIVCNLLAHGSRVLVTSQSPSALRVLKGLLKEHASEFLPLCVNLLGNDQESRQDLESSVSSIDAKLDDDAASQRTKELPDAAGRLSDLRTGLAKTQSDLYARLNRERVGMGPLFSRYSGTPGDIAQQLEMERPDIGWLEDGPSLTDVSPLDCSEVSRFIELARICGANPLNPLDREAARLLSLPTPRQVLDWAVRLDEAAQVRARQPHSEGEVLSALAAMYADDAEMADQNVRQYIGQADMLPVDEYPWLLKALRASLGNIGELWLHLQSITEATHEKLEAVQHTSIVSEPSTVSTRSQIATDARRRLAQLRANPKQHMLKKWIARDLRETKYLERWVVNGVPCRDIPALEHLVAYLDAELALDDWHEEWSEHLVGSASITFAQKTIRVKTHLNLLNKVRELSELASCIHKQIKCPATPRFSCVTADDARRLLVTLNDASVIREEMSIRKALGDINTNIAGLPARASSSLVQEIDIAVSDRDFKRLGALLDQWEDLVLLCKDYDERDILASKARPVLPIFTSQLLNDPTSSHWDERTQHFLRAFEHAQMRTEVERISAAFGVAELWAEQKRLRDEIFVATARLASLKAWTALDQRVQRAAREDLRAWGQAAKQASRSGLRAAAARVRARELMPKCQDIVPAWIMPLFKVYEQHSATTSMPYDVVILDEASQANPWALAVFFLARKVLIVGDEYQTAPETIGVKDEEAADLSSRYLRNVSATLQQALTYTNSLYDVAGVKAPKRVYLREHFRCMPEIIEYSNRLCYKPNGHPLLALRQYPPKRLDPIRTTYVHEGRREGQGSSVINRREAEAVAQAIADCCGSEEYAGKSMAVLCLQGREQSQLIQKLVRAKVGPREIDARDMKFGVPAALQGDERDIVFISMVAAQGDTNVVALTKPEDQRRFNVAISRARDQVWVFHSLTEQDLSQKCYRRGLLAYLREARAGFDHVDGLDVASFRAAVGSTARQRGNHPVGFDSWFEVDMCLQIAAKGYRVRPHVPFGSYTVDLVVEGENCRLAVECDGDHVHGEANWEEDARRQADLERCGLKFWRVRYSEYYLDREKATLTLWSSLNDMGILPVGATPRQTPSHVRDEEPVPPWEIPQCNGEPLSEDNDRTEELELTEHDSGFSPGAADYAAEIVRMLASRPNQTCTEKGLSDLVLRSLGVTNLRGRHRDAEKRRIHDALKSLQRRQAVERYRNPGENANWRLRLLVWE